MTERPGLGSSYESCMTLHDSNEINSPPRSKILVLLLISHFISLTVMDRGLREAVRRSMSLIHLRPSPKHLSATEIRKSFLDYFCEDNKHLYIRSSPVFSLKDPTLAFTNAGMNQFKDVFLGMIRPASNRVANSQKCIRVGGVHNDLSEVGQDGSHHTFFEMLGNWSFGDYFKKEACRMSWNLLTEVYGIPPERLYVTYFGGDEALGLSADVEVREIWREIGVKDSHILTFGAKDNFWAGSPTGPCGTCTEIHYDHCPGRTDVGHLVNCGSDEVTELWNLVFIQYDRKSNGELANLKKHFVDTGMGLERLVAVMQGKTSNYDTDLFLPLFEAIRKHTGHSGYGGKYDGNAVDYSYRVLADHSRMIAVALSDGMIPNHHGKVRTVMRKALTVADKIFNSRGDLLKELTSHVAEILSDAYPEVGRHLSKIHYIIDIEEEILKSNRARTLARWQKTKALYPAVSDAEVLDTPQILTCLDYINKNILKKGKSSVSPEDAFVLLDTLGVPVQVTSDLAVKLNLAFDMSAYLEYESCRKKVDKTHLHERYLKDRTQYSNSDILVKLLERNIPPTTDYFKHDYRVDSSGKYIFKHQETTIEAFIRGNDLTDAISAEDIKEEEEIGIVLDRTQLFCEEGGQASDRGTLEIENGIIFDITRLVKLKNFVIHFGHFRHIPRDSKVTARSLGVLKIDEDRRLAIMRSHTALHLLNAAIQDEISVVAEKSSAVNPDNLQLNFMVYKKNLDSFDGVKKLEKFVKDFILHGTSVKRTILNHPQFQALDDVVFNPGETILEREIPVIEVNSGFKLSKQYCTGTHVLNTSHLKDFVVQKFIKGSYGVSVIKAATGEKCSKVRKADAEIQERWNLLEKEIGRSSRSHPSKIQDLFSRVKQISSEISDSDKISHITRTTLNAAVSEGDKNLDSFMKMSIKNYLGEELKKAFTESSEMFVVHCLDTCWKFNPEDLESVAECFQDKPIFAILKHEDSVAIQCIVPANFVSRTFSARNWLSESIVAFGGIGKCGQDKNPDLTYFIQSRNVSEDKLHLITRNAAEFAKKNVEGWM